MDLSGKDSSVDFSLLVWDRQSLRAVSS